MQTGRYVYTEGSDGKRRVGKLAVADEAPKPQASVDETLFGGTAFRVPERPSLTVVKG